MRQSVGYNVEATNASVVSENRVSQHKIYAMVILTVVVSLDIILRACNHA